MKVSPELERKYTLVRLLGRGGMGEVHLAHDPALNRHVAIKFLIESASPDTESKARFREEARVGASLKHPHIVSLFATGEDLGNLYLVFDFVEGVTMQQLLALQGPRPVAEAVRLATQLLSGLACAHEQGVIHRDLKPGNIMIRKETGDAMIMDFGLARARGRDFQTQQGILMGTPAYMAPEQIRGEPASVASDIYAFGCTLYHMLVGKPPYGDASDHDTLRLQLKGPPPRPLHEVDPAIPRTLERVVARALEKDPAQRWASATAMLSALEDLSHKDERASQRTMALTDTGATRPPAPLARPVPARSTGIPAPAPASRGLLPWLAATGLVLATLAAFAFHHHRSSRLEVLEASTLARYTPTDHSTVRVQLDVTDLTEAALHLRASSPGIEGVRSESGWSFLLPVAPGELIEAPLVRAQGPNGRREYRLPALPGLAPRLTQALEDGPPDGVIGKMVEDRRFIRDTLSLTAARPGTPDFTAVVLRELAALPYHQDLEWFRERATPTFSDPSLDDAARKGLYLATMKLLPLDLFCLSQRQKAPLEIQRLVSSQQSLHYSLETAGGPPGDVVLIRDTTCWFSAGFDMYPIMREWHEKGSPPDVAGKAPGERRGPGPSDYRHTREYLLPRKPPGSADGKITLRAHVSYLDCKFFYEVVFRGAGGRGDLIVPLCSPGTYDWITAMDGVLPGQDVKPVENPDDFLGSASFYLAMQNHWALIEVSLPVSWFPEAPTKVEVRYRSLPGARLRDLSDNQRLSYMKLLDLR